MNTDPLRDPVCGMTVKLDTPHQLQHDGRPYYFCSAGCKFKFVADPIKYVGEALEIAAPVHATATVAATDSPAVRAIYTCPMHPEIRQDHPGNCPICGMTLEPVLPTLEADDDSELSSFQRRFWRTLPLTVVVTTLAMFGHRFGWFDMAVQSWIELVLTLPVVLWAGWPFFVRGAQSVIHQSPNMWTLIGLGTGAAFVYSVVATIAPNAFPASFISMGRVELDGHSADGVSQWIHIHFTSPHA